MPLKLDIFPRNAIFITAWQCLNLNFLSQFDLPPKNNHKIPKIITRLTIRHAQAQILFEVNVPK